MCGSSLRCEISCSGCLWLIDSDCVKEWRELVSFVAEGEMGMELIGRLPVKRTIWRLIWVMVAGVEPVGRELNIQEKWKSGCLRRLPLWIAFE